jgi:hypothetical protein
MRCMFMNLALGPALKQEMMDSSVLASAGGTIDSSQRWYGELGTVKLVELLELLESESAVDEDGLSRAWGRP